MTGCLAESDVEEIGMSASNDFDEQISTISDKLCAPFRHEASRLEASLLIVYKMVASMARAEEDLDKVAKFWSAMVDVCDRAMRSLQQLCDRHPACEADFYKDRIADLRNKCNRLKMMHS